MSLYYDSSVLVKLYVREEFSDAVARFLAERREAVVINDLHDIEMRNALRLKRFREEVDDEQLAASMAMLSSDLAARRLIRTAVDWQSVISEAKHLSAAATTDTGVRTIDLLHVAAALIGGATGLVSLDHRQRAAARFASLGVIEFTG